MTQKTPRPTSLDVGPERRNIRILLIEDDEGDAYVVQEILRQNAHKSDLERFDLHHADTLAAGLGRLLLGGIDIVLLDLTLPDSRGIESLQRVRAQAPDVPVVILSGMSNEEIALEAVRAGAQDYLMKGQVEFMWLTRVMRYAIERKQTEIETRKLYRELENRINERTTQLEESYRKLAAEAERHEETKADVQARGAALEEAASALGAGVVLCDRTGRIQISSPRVKEITGVEWTDFSRRQWVLHGQFFESDGRTPLPAERLPLARALDGEAVDWMEIVMRLPDRPEATRMRVKAIPLRDAGGEPLGAMALVSAAG